MTASGRGDAVRVSVTVSGLRRLFGDDLAAVVDVARQADEAGIDQLVMPDHLAMGPRTDRYPFAEKFPYPPDEPWLEPMTVLAAMAAGSERVRLGTGVLIAPLRPALVIARTAATIDVLSRGRLDLGVGVGWQREEYTDAGLPFVGRTARMDDAIRACRAVWEQDPPVSFESPTVSFAELWTEPRPVQPRLPVWFAGGPTEATARRIAQLGDGWLPLGISDDELAAGVELIRKACADEGRDPAEIGVRAGLPVGTRPDGSADLDRTLARVPEVEALGATAGSLALGRFIRTRADIGPFLRDVAAAFEGGAR